MPVIELKDAKAAHDAGRRVWRLCYAPTDPPQYVFWVAPDGAPPLLEAEVIGTHLEALHITSFTP